jgi:hypothetical protein
VAVSANQDTGLSFEDAFQQAESGNQRAFRKIIQGLMEQAGLKGHTYEAIGDAADGTEANLLQEITEASDPAQIDYLASWYGLLANQKSVLVFHPDHSGADSFYTVDVPATDLAALRKVLDAYNIPFRTLVRRGKGIQVAIFDQNRELRGQVAQFTGAVHGRIQESVGRGHLLGSDSGSGPSRQADSRSEYRKVIEQYEARSDAPARTPAGGLQAGQAPLRHSRRLPAAGRWTFTGLRAPAPLRLGRRRIRQGEWLSRDWWEVRLRREERARGSIHLARINAPAGGVVVRGVQYQGGKFLPAGMVEKATFPQYQQITSQGGNIRTPQKYRRPDGSFDRAFLPSPGDDPILKAQQEQTLNAMTFEAEEEPD